MKQAQGTNLINEKNGLLYLIGLFLFFAFLINYSWQSSKKLHAAGGYNEMTKAVVTKKQRNRPARAKNIIYYQYEYKGKKYNDDDPDLTYSFFNKVEVKDTIDIMINDKFPDYSMIFYDGNSRYWDGE